MKKRTAHDKLNFTANKLSLRSVFVCAVFFLTFITSCASKDVKQFKIQADEYLTEAKFKGTVLIGKGDKILFAQGYGPEDKKNKESPQNSISTIYEAGSITKQMTAAAIMQLEQKRKLSTKDKLSKYFPDYEHGNEITLEMLLNMHSGLTDYINSADEFFPKNIYRHIENNQLSNKPVDKDIVLTYFYDAPLLTKPNSTYFYCNTNYYLLAKIIEQVSGETYGDYIQNHIFNPCKMTDSNLNFQKTSGKGYDYKDRYYSIPEALAFGCGDLNTNVQDLLKWNCAFHSGKVISRKSYKKMTAADGYGFGIYCSPEYLFHSGTTNVFNSYMAYYPDKKISIIVLENCPISEQNATFIAGNLVKILKNNTKY